MSFVPQPCDSGGLSDECCPSVFVGFCLSDGTPIALSFLNSVQIGWTNIETGIFTAGPPPSGTELCAPTPVEVSLSCETDSVTVCPPDDDAPFHVIIDNAPPVTGTPLSCETDSVTICPGLDPITVDGIVALDATTLIALETITVNQGTSPWVVSAIDFDIRNLDCLTDSVTICGTVEVTGAVAVDFDYPEDSLHVSGDIGAFVLGVRNDANAILTTTDGDYSPIAVDADGAIQISDGGNVITVDGTVALDAPTLAALETITVLQGTSPWVVSGTVSVTEPVTVDAIDLDIRNLLFATDKVDVSGSDVDVVSSPKTSTINSGPTRVTVDDTAVSLLASLATRKRFFIQNVGTTTIYLGFGGTAPTLTVYYVALSPGVVIDDGKGATYMDELWTGQVQAISSIDGGLVVITELA